MPRKQAVLSSGENIIYQQLQQKLWADMQRIFPRLAAFDSPRNQPLIRRRPIREEKEKVAGEKTLC